MIKDVKVISGTNLNVISENLTELLQNSINMSSVFYDIFLNPEPMDVELKQFGYKSSQCNVYENIGSVVSASAEDKEIVIAGDKAPTVGSVLLIKDTSVIDGLYVVTAVEAGAEEITVNVAQAVKTDYSPASATGVVGLQIGQIRKITASTKTITAVGSLTPSVGSSIFFTGVEDTNSYEVTSASIASSLVTIVVEEDTLTNFSNPVEFQPIIIPNRAKDHTIAIMGTGAPLASLNAVIGTCYVDSLNKIVYFKIAEASGGESGWTPVLTDAGVISVIATYLANGQFVNKEYLDTYLTDYITGDELTTRLEGYNPTISMTDLTSETASTIPLEDNKGYYLTRSTAVNFQLPLIDNLSILHKIFLQLNVTTPIAVTFLGVTSYFDGVQPTFSATGMYNVIFEYDNATGQWVCGSTYKGPQQS